MIHKFNSILAGGSSGRLVVWPSGDCLLACRNEFPNWPRSSPSPCLALSLSSLLVHALVVPKTVANTTDPTSKHPTGNTGNTGKRHNTFICGSAVAARQQCSLCCCCCCCCRWPPVNALVINYVCVYVCLDLCVCVFLRWLHGATRKTRKKTKAKCCNAIAKLINKTHMFCVKFNN